MGFCIKMFAFHFHAGPQWLLLALVLSAQWAVKSPFVSLCLNEEKLGQRLGKVDQNIATALPEKKKFFLLWMHVDHNNVNVENVHTTSNNGHITSK